jgi:uncharacterized protein
MKTFSLVDFSVRRPKSVLILALLLTLGFATQFPKIQIDTNPKNMLPPTSRVRVWNDEVDRTFGLYQDMIVVGIVDSSAVLNRDTLSQITDLTAKIVSLPGVASRDVAGFTTIDNVTTNSDGSLRVGPLLAGGPRSDEEISSLRKALFENPLFLGRIISEDGTTAAIYVPLEKGANGKQVADQIRALVRTQSGRQRYYVAGDPVARDTFGAQMFRLMGLFSPVAGVVMFAAIYWIFRNLSLAMSMMAVAMISIIWSMGLLIGLGFPVHIMSSMAPVFLMAIATDSIHIFNEFYFRYRETPDKQAAIRQTMDAVGRPVKYTALATAAGFAILLFMHIVPVKVFGGVIVFGTLVLRLLSFSFIPAVLALVPEHRIAKAVTRQLKDDSKTGWLPRIAALPLHRPNAVVLAVGAIVCLSIFGMTRLVIDNNQVEWFTRGSEVRIADDVLNHALGGTAVGYIVAVADQPGAIKTPESLRYVAGLQKRLEQLPQVGKTVSVADYVKRINRVLHNDDPAYDRIPDQGDVIGQYLFLFGMSAKQSDLDNVVDYPFQRANVWVQLKTWDAHAMRKVMDAAAKYAKEHPSNLDLHPAGTAYFNVVWNNEVLWDMVKGFILAVIAVFVILLINFRSVKWALLGFVPLLFTIVLIFGVIGFVGKNFDMPISVLSCLSLGMAVDFSIHYVSRLRSRIQETSLTGLSPDEVLAESILWTTERPGKGIVRNALLFAAAFGVMLFAPLTPYITVGAFIVSMMLLSALATLVVLPALVVMSRKRLFPAVAVTAAAYSLQTHSGVRR